MPSPERRSAGRRGAWGRGPVSLRLESLERRALMAAPASSSLPDLVNSALSVSTNVADWGNSLQVMGQVKNQGSAATAAPLQVSLYASAVRGVSKYSVSIGEVTIPAGIQPGEVVPYNTTASIPDTPIANFNGSNIYISAWVNPSEAIAESNVRNDRDLGPPYDVAPVVIQAPQPADLVGTTLAVNTPTTTWGSSISVTAQVTNEGSGSSPQTTALLSLTPQGLNFGDSTTVGIGTITIPPLAPSQTYNVVQNVNLPAVEPLSINAYTDFGLTMTQDANYVTDDLYPNQPNQGVGYDQAPMTITTSSTSTATTGALPDLAASTVLGPTGTLRWGQSIQVNTEIQNLGQGDAGSFQVFFLLTGQAGTINNAIYLGQATVSSLAAGSTEPLTQTLTLPTRVPAGVTLNSVGYARIAMIVDPDNVVNEALKSNDQALSAPFIVRLPGTATTVPTKPVAGSLPSVASVAAEAQATAKAQAALRRAARIEARVGTGATKKLHRRAAPKTDTIVNKGVSLATELTKLPHQIESVITKAV